MAWYSPCHITSHSKTFLHCYTRKLLTWLKVFDAFDDKLAITVVNAINKATIPSPLQPKLKKHSKHFPSHNQWLMLLTPWPRSAALLHGPEHYQLTSQWQMESHWQCKHPHISCLCLYLCALTAKNYPPNPAPIWPSLFQSATNWEWLLHLDTPYSWSMNWPENQTPSHPSPTSRCACCHAADESHQHTQIVSSFPVQTTINNHDLK